MDLDKPLQAGVESLQSTREHQVRFKIRQILECTEVHVGHLRTFAEESHEGDFAQTLDETVLDGIVESSLGGRILLGSGFLIPSGHEHLGQIKCQLCQHRGPSTLVGRMKESVN